MPPRRASRALLPLSLHWCLSENALNVFLSVQSYGLQLHCARNVGTLTWSSLNVVLFCVVAERRTSCDAFVAVFDAQLFMTGHVLVVSDRRERMLVPVLEDRAIAAGIDSILLERVGFLWDW